MCRRNRKAATEQCIRQAYFYATNHDMANLAVTDRSAMEDIAMAAGYSWKKFLEILDDCVDGEEILL